MTSEQIKLILDVLWGEGAGEPIEGKVAILSTILNRLATQKDLKKVLKAYSAYSTKSKQYQKASLGNLNPYEMSLYEQNRDLLNKILSGEVKAIPDITHFENVDMFGEPVWVNEVEPVGKFGSQMFYKRKAGRNPQ